VEAIGGNYGFQTVVSADAHRGRSAAQWGEMKTIVIGADGSPTGRAAVEAGVELAAEEGARVVVVHVVSILDFAERQNGHGAPPPQRLPKIEEDPVLQSALETAARHAVDANAELLVGYPPTQIARLAADVDADLIVVGSRGLSRMKSMLLGSTSRDLLAHAGRPVLVVPPAPAIAA
jgi:nucleotide-binding universal stress UspA family protein